MKISHNFTKPKISFEKNKTSKDITAFTTNKIGGFLNISDSAKSRYEGLFFSDKNFNIFKTIEEIEPVEGGLTKKIENNFYEIKRVRKNLDETFFFPNSFNSLVYQASKEAQIEITFDFKKLFANPEFGKFYNIYEDKNCLIIEFKQKNDFKIYLAIKAEKLNYKKLDEWIEKEYIYDKERNSPPYSQFVFKGLLLKANEVVFSTSTEKNKAIDEAKLVFSKIEQLKQRKKKTIEKLFNDRFSKKIEDRNVYIAYQCAKNSLYSLLNFTGAKIEKRYRLFAGLPWFAQFWKRDEFISLKSIYDTHLLTTSQVKVLIFDALTKMAKKDQNLLKNQNADSYGWLFKRINELLELKKFNYLEKKALSKIIKKVIEISEEKYKKDGLIMAETKSTWMDTLKRNYGPIEIQALHLSIYNLAFKLTKKDKYKEMEKELLERVRLFYFNKGALADCRGDFTQRPNIFLSFYIYPEMLEKSEWESSFENALKHLWLKWGGLSTLSKTSDYFNEHHTGEDPTSYHNGDSWFFINNIAALSMFELNKKKFGEYINKIIEASAKDIISYGAIANASELSDAQNFKPAGSPMQAWSSATFIELIRKVF